MMGWQLERVYKFDSLELKSTADRLAVNACELWSVATPLTDI